MSTGVTEKLQQEHAAREWRRCVELARKCNGANGVILVPRAAILYAAKALGT